MNVKPCNICKEKINIDIEHYCILEEIKNKKQVSKGYYHVKCYREKFIVPNQELKKLIKATKDSLPTFEVI